MARARIRDVDIRRSLHEAVRRRHANEPDTLFLDELGLCQGVVRVDLAVVNDSIHGYEIKSECDTLSRLPSQREVYSRSLDFVTIVASRKHLKEVRRAVPRWWGIWCANAASAGVELSEVRAPRGNPGADAGAVAQLLWRDEALEELANRGLARGVRSKARRDVWAALANALSLGDLSAVVRERLKHRQNWRVLVQPMSDGDSSPPFAMWSRCLAQLPRGRTSQ